MASGGARARSGPAPDLDSKRSERLGRRNGLLVLPLEGYHGTPPAFPLAGGASEREQELWETLWSTPQAAAWATMPHLHHPVAVYTRYMARSEEPDSPASVLTAAMRVGDSIGITVTGMAAHGWTIATEDIVIRTDDVDRDNPKIVRMHERRRLPGDR